MAPQRHFSPALFKFLRDLKANNSREWFKANKPRYEEEVRQPALRFITDFAPHLGKISKFFRADPRPVGGSLFRIYRDIRFSKDKSPYKTHVGIHFRHEAGKDAYTPGFYLHLEPVTVFVGVGLWHPDNTTLRKIRDAVVNDPGRFKRSIGGKKFKERFVVTGESLKRPPVGYDPEHPLIDYLKLKDFTALARLNQKDVTSAGFIARFAAECRAGSPLVKFICQAVGVGF
jgi:uncharacterized protein (TIGR02453 family)